MRRRPAMQIPPGSRLRQGAKDAPGNPPPPAPTTLSSAPALGGLRNVRRIERVNP